MQKWLDYEIYENNQLRTKLQNAIGHLEELFPLKGKILILEQQLKKYKAQVEKQAQIQKTDLPIQNMQDIEILKAHFYENNRCLEMREFQINEQQLSQGDNLNKL